MVERRYIAIVFGLTALLVLAISAVNYMVNPLGIYAEPHIRGFNDVHPAADNYVRLLKIESVKHLKPDAVIIGTSRAETGLDPKPEFFPGMTPYNFAVPAAGIIEQRRMLEFAQAVHPLKMAVLTLDFFAFNARRLENRAYDPGRLSPEATAQPRSFFDTYGTLVALDTFIASIKHLRALRKGKPYDDTAPNGHKISAGVAAQVAQEGAGKRFRHPPNESEIAVDDFSFSYTKTPGDTTFQHLEAMLDFARRHDIRVILLISPAHETYLETLEKTGKKPLVEQWMSRVAAINRDSAARYGAKPYPLWDFSGRGRFTTEAVPLLADKTAHPKWFWDSNHYKIELGDIVLRRIMGMDNGESPDFGKRLD